MKKDLADVTIVVDRSGSMDSCRVEAENGVNHFMDEQRKQDGQCLFSLLQFDTEHEFVHSGRDLDTITDKYVLQPRGMTALLDAVGRTICKTGERLAAIPENDRPGLVVFVIVTDGLENSSSEFTREQIRGMIERQQKEYSWQFTFLGANQDAFAEAASIGIQMSAAANYKVSKSAEAYKASSDAVKRMRGAAIAGQSVKMSYTAEERQAMEED